MINTITDQDRTETELETVIDAVLHKMFEAIVEHRILHPDEKALVASLRAWCDVVLGNRAVSAAERRELEIVVGVTDGLTAAFAELLERN